MISPFDVFRKTNITVRNFTGGSFVNGKWVEGVASDSQAVVNLQPLSAKETSLLQSLTEGRRQKEGFKIYTDLSFNIVGDENPTIVIFENIEYEVISKSNWKRINRPVDHYKYLIMKRDIVND